MEPVAAGWYDEDEDRPAGGGGVGERLDEGVDVLQAWIVLLGLRLLGLLILGD